MTRKYEPHSLKGDEKARYVAGMFARISGRYDLLNTVMTGRMHHHWRKLTAQIATKGLEGSALGALLHGTAHVGRKPDSTHLCGDQDSLTNITNRGSTKQLDDLRRALLSKSRRPSECKDQKRSHFQLVQFHQPPQRSIQRRYILIILTTATCPQRTSGFAWH